MATLAGNRKKFPEGVSRTIGIDRFRYQTGRPRRSGLRGLLPLAFDALSFPVVIHRPAQAGEHRQTAIGILVRPNPALAGQNLRSLKPAQRATARPPVNLLKPHKA